MAILFPRAFVVVVVVGGGAGGGGGGGGGGGVGAAAAVAAVAVVTQGGCGYWMVMKFTLRLGWSYHVHPWVNTSGFQISIGVIWVFAPLPANCHPQDWFFTHS